MHSDGSSPHEGIYRSWTADGTTLNSYKEKGVFKTERLSYPSPASMRKFDPEMVSITSDILQEDIPRSRTLQRNMPPSYLNAARLKEENRCSSAQSLNSISSMVSRTSVISKIVTRIKKGGTRKSSSVADLLQEPTISTRRLSDAYRLQVDHSDPKIHIRDSQTLKTRHASTANLFGEEVHESFGISLTALNESLNKSEYTDTFVAPLRRTVANPFGLDLEDDRMEEVYKATVGCLISKCPADNTMPKERYLMKAFKLSKSKHQDLQQKAEQEQKPDISLHVEVAEADSLMARKGHGKSDPYCKVAVVPSQHTQNFRVDLTDLRKGRLVEGLIISHTDVKENTLEPQWNTCFNVQLEEVEAHSLAVEIWDSEQKISLRKVKGLKGLKNYLKDLRGRNDFLGKASISLENISSAGTSDWFNLVSHRGKPRGRVRLKMDVHIKMKGVSLEVALDYYEKLFEVFCTTKATSAQTASNPDLLGNLPEDSMFAEDWSCELSPTADHFLSLFASRHGITEIQQAIVKLGSTMKYHIAYGASVEAFQRLYSIILDKRDQLDMSESGMSEPATVKMVQKLAACTKSLTGDVLETVRRHPVQVNLTSQFEVDKFEHQVLLLKDLHSVSCLVEQTKENGEQLKGIILEEIKGACGDWYALTSKRALKEASARVMGRGGSDDDPQQSHRMVLALLSTVQTMVQFIAVSREKLQPVFNQLEISYYDCVYMGIESKLAADLDRLVARGPIADSHSGYILYLGLKEFQYMAAHLEESKKKELQLPGFHRHFKSMVKDWIGLASQRLKEGIVKAASKVAEETVTNLTLFSVNSRDLIDLIAMVCDFWRKLSWPDPKESYEFLIHLVEELCEGVVMFAQETCSLLAQKEFFNPQPGSFNVTRILCITLNDIEQVRGGVHELPEFVTLRHLKEDLQDAGSELAGQAEQNVANILEAMDQRVFAILSNVCAQIVERMKPDIKKGLKKVSEAKKANDFETAITPLMNYLHGNLQELQSSVFQSVFIKFLTGLWAVIIDKMEKYSAERHKDNIRSIHFCNLLQVLHEFFHSEGEGIAIENLESHQYMKLHDVLSYRTMSTDKLLQRYYQDLLAFQANAPTSRGTILLSVSYMKEKQVIGLRVIRAAGLPAVSIHNSCDCYLKISAVPEASFTNAVRMKSDVYKRTCDPVIEAEFALPAKESTLSLPGSAVLVEVYSYDHLKAHTPVGVVAVSCRDIPVLAPHTVPENEELVVQPPKRKTLELPIITPCQTLALKELQERSYGGDALKRIKRLMHTGKKHPSQSTNSGGGGKATGSPKPKRIFNFKKS